MYGFVRIISAVVRYMKTIYLTTKTIQIKSCTICSIRSFLKDQSKELHSPLFTILHDKRNTFSFNAIISGSIYRASGSVYEVSYP